MEEVEEPDGEIKAILAKYRTQESNIDELLETR